MFTGGYGFLQNLLLFLLRLSAGFQRSFGVYSKLTLGCAGKPYRSDPIGLHILQNLCPPQKGGGCEKGEECNFRE
jgi:hypothetical protein